MLYVRRIVGRSMQPSFRPGQVVIFRKSDTVRIGQVVMADVNGREVIKRVQRVDGSVVELFGDNPDGSTDSRSYGPISTSQIKGVAVLAFL